MDTKAGTNLHQVRNTKYKCYNIHDANKAKQQCAAA